MPKLSATTPSDSPTEVSRVDITPEMIKSSSDEQLNTLLRQLRGNREVATQKRAGGAGPARPKKAPDADVEDVFGDD